MSLRRQEYCFFPLLSLYPAAAVQRKYESVHRLWKLKEKDDFEEASKQLSISKRYRDIELDDKGYT